MITVLYRCPDNMRIGDIFIKGNNVLNFYEESQWDKVYNKYKGYFDKRTCSDANPRGVFIINTRKDVAEDTGKEFDVIAKENTKEDHAKAVMEELEETSPESAKILKDMEDKQNPQAIVVNTMNELDNLKKEATEKGIRFHPSISLKKLSKKIKEFCK